MDDRLPRAARRARCLALVHHHRDLAAEMLFVEAEGCFAIPAEVQLRIELHRFLRARTSDYLRDKCGLPLNVGFAVARKARSQRLLEVTVLSCDRGIRTQRIPKRQVLLPESATFFNEMNVIRAWLTAAKELVVRNAPVTAVLVPCPLEESHILVDRGPTRMTGQDIEHGVGAESRNGRGSDVFQVH